MDLSGAAYLLAFPAFPGLTRALNLEIALILVGIAASPKMRRPIRNIVADRDRQAERNDACSTADTPYRVKRTLSGRVDSRSQVFRLAAARNRHVEASKSGQFSRRRGIIGR